MNIKNVLEKLTRAENLTEEECSETMDAIACGKVDPVQIGSFLSLLRAKGETPEEVSALVNVMLRHCVQVDIPGKALDIVGTGGDGANTVNLSTGAAILTAACGAKVAKHGNRSVSSKSGSADVLEEMGVPMLQPEQIEECVEQANIAFMYSPHFHPSMKHVVPARRALGIRTVFNILGPLLNPARCKHMMVGVFKPELLELYGDVYKSLGVDHALVIHCCGLDELNPMGVAEAVEITKEKGVVRLQIDPKDLGIPPCKLEDLKGGDAEENAAILRRTFSGGEHADTAIGNTIAFNAAAGLYVYGLAESIKDGYKIAKETLRSGEALATLDRWSKVAQSLNKQDC